MNRNVKGLSEETKLRILKNAFVDATISGGKLILRRFDGTGENAGSVAGDGLTPAETDDVVANLIPSSSGSATSDALNAAIDNRVPTAGAGVFVGSNRQGRASFDTLDAAALRAFRASLAGAQSSPVNVAFLGHSMVEGYSTTQYADRFADSTVQALRRRVGLTGGLGHKKGFKTFGATDYPITIAGTKLASGDAGMGAGGAAILGSPYGPATVAIPVGTTSVDIVWVRKAGFGSFTYALDGGAASAPVNCAGTPTSGYQVTNVTVDPGSPHTLVVTGSSGFTNLVGVTFYAGDETKGIRSWEGGKPSANSGQYLSGAITSNSQWLDIITGTQPSLIVFTILCNDFYNSTSPNTNNVPSATSKTNIKAIIDAVAAKCTVRPSVVLCVENIVKDGTASPPEPWANYVQAYYDLAAAEGYAVFDFNKRLGLTTSAVPGVSAGLINADQIHPTNKGHRFWGEALGAFLAPH